MHKTCLSFASRPARHHARCRAGAVEIAAILVLRFMACPAAAILAAPASAQTIPATPADRPDIAYPPEAGAASGSVTIEFTVAPDGRVIAPKILASTGPSLFEATAMSGVAQWTYHPRLQAGRPAAQPGNRVNLHFEPPPPADSPQQLFAETLSYPRAAYEAHQEGHAVVGFAITPAGTTTGVHIINASPAGVFDHAAIDYVRTWEFGPTDNHQPITGQTADIVFRLSEATLAPRPQRKLALGFPGDAERAGIIGDCHAEYWIEPDGSTSDAHILYCTPAGYFETATLAAIKRATYIPEADPFANRRRVHTLHVKFRIEGHEESEAHYLQPGQWVVLRYTLTPRGRTRDIEIIGQSAPGIDTFRAVDQLRQTSFSPALEGGQPVEKHNQTIIIAADRRG